MAVRTSSAEEVEDRLEWIVEMIHCPNGAHLNKNLWLKWIEGI